jgi:hypothetical protein
MNESGEPLEEEEAEALELFIRHREHYLVIEWPGVLFNKSFQVLFECGASAHISASVARIPWGSVVHVSEVLNNN